MIDLKAFPAELNLFEAESAWRIHDRVAIVNDAVEGSLDGAETILRSSGFGRRDIEAERLEAYYAQGDESVLEGGAPTSVEETRSGRGEPHPALEGGIILPEVPSSTVFEPRSEALIMPLGEATPRRRARRPDRDPKTRAEDEGS
ncbi:hypothetical protein AC482_04675 [miscellaneous Crenarchaeota group-15 archaeon DG-45]|uniref:Uncharacterized protein n=1 Tax=miscellaneous Crenarchaeota group-15 archaeon DG-45 TaxID=1685127 RepID=A0A0M0BNI0_9ARCH|nr:MAG: hypothetical protein AC482_04675 [miscellaneous Crenarchaeota group-15 archaeon DG-45]